MRIEPRPGDPLVKLWVHLVTVAPRTGDGPTGRTYGTPYELPCWLDDRVRLVLASTGEQIISPSTVYGPSTCPDIPPGSRISRPSGREMTVIAAQRHDSGQLGLPDHVEISLQ